MVENLSEAGPTRAIKAEGTTYTACDDGKAPFASATDIV